MSKNKKVKLVKKKICKNAFRGYWKKKSIALIPKYRPGAKPDDYTIEEIEVPENFPVPEILDPNTTPLSVVKEICNIIGIPFSWVTQITPETITSTIANSPLSEAIEYFLVFGTNGTTLSQYRRIFQDLSEGGVIALNMLVTDYLEGCGKIKADALNFSDLGNARDKSHYNYNDKIYNVLKSFYLFLQNPNHFSLKYGKSATTTDSSIEEDSSNPSESDKTESKAGKVKFDIATFFRTLRIQTSC
ncbi:MAG: hypothetical protein JSS09_01650 [Verrucomicrobia bacterium]|nr:hypothetical protein [Verrucomicrobiota bacterium]